jgi:hypothetical protein
MISRPASLQFAFVGEKKLSLSYWTKDNLDKIYQNFGRCSDEQIHLSLGGSVVRICCALWTVLFS